MIHSCKRETITVVQLGSTLDSSSIEQALHRANELQVAFYFQPNCYGTRLPLGEEYRLANGGFDLCGAVKQALTHDEAFNTVPRPLLVLSNDAFGDPDFPSDPDAFYFSSQEDDYDPQVTIISTQPVSELAGVTLESYLFMMLSTHILSKYANISYHRQARGCLLDYDGEWTNDENCLREGILCEECEDEIRRRVSQKKVSIEIIAAAIRLFNRAIGHRYCFVIMPFLTDLNCVYELIRSVLEEKGWQVKRADEVFLHRLITDGIFQEIVTADLVVADLSGLNPNVFYEVGLTHALGNDLLLISQDRLPTDLTVDHALFYQTDQLESLKKMIKKRVPTVTSGVSISQTR
jgi:hypothetical protein